MESLATNLGNTFIQRWDLYPKQLSNGNYICIHKPLRKWHLTKHLAGEMTLGAYVLNQRSQASFMVIDADDDRQLGCIQQIAVDLGSKRVPTYLETSCRGGHLWFFFEQPLSGKTIRKFGKKLLSDYGITKTELFPKQSKLSSGPGSLIRLPFGIHQQSGERYRFIIPGGQMLAPTLDEQILILCAPETISTDTIQSILKQVDTTVDVSPRTPLETKPGSLSKHIKESIPVFDFVGQYVELSPTGRGLCPFHDDHHASFSVNIEENYWHCFAGCGGGSIIDFWMKWKDCDFTEAIKELALVLFDS